MSFIQVFIFFKKRKKISEMALACTKFPEVSRPWNKHVLLLGCSIIQNIWRAVIKSFFQLTDLSGIAYWRMNFVLIFSVTFMSNKTNEANCIQLIPNFDWSKRNILVIHATNSMKFPSRICITIKQKRDKRRCTLFVTFTYS